MRIDPAFGVIEIGNIYWGPLISRKPAATEAQFLFMQYAFDGSATGATSGNATTATSRRSARRERFGFTFEGIFRQHMVVKGENRDTAWYSIIDKEWPALKRAYQEWLDPANFDGRRHSRSGGSKRSGPRRRHSLAACSTVTTIAITTMATTTPVTAMARMATATVARMARPTRRGC